MSRTQSSHPADVATWQTTPGTGHVVHVLRANDYSIVYEDTTPRTYLQAMAEAGRLKATWPDDTAGLIFCWTS